jgi:hypothetical protein
MMELVVTFHKCSVNMPKNSFGGGSFGSHAILFHSFTLHHIYKYLHLSAENYTVTNTVTYSTPWVPAE